MNPTNRREFLQHSLTLAVLAALPLQLQAQIISKTPQASGFDDSSTAEEVTAGLDLSGKTYAITGVNSGLGFETMRVLTLRGAHVIGSARTQAKADVACASVEGKTTPMFLDLAQLDSVVACAERIRALDIPVDGLICNAGIMALPELEQVNGIERQFAVNHLGHFVLINQMIDVVAKSEQGRFVLLSSLAHKRAPEGGIQFDNLSGEGGDYAPWTAYGQSKLANALCSRELAHRLSDTAMTSNSVHPGIIATNLGRHMPWYMRWGGALFGWAFMKSVPEGAATQTYVATNPSLVGVRGYYFADCNVAEGTDYLNDDALAKRLWDISVELTQPYLPATALSA
jgi:NAD(P)-dependent dehydrogenase (short-subunit alcohol dehydrogenase family)